MKYYGKQTCSNSDLQHWKYTSKKRVNGKWRYFYDYYDGNVGHLIRDKLGYDERRDAAYARSWRDTVTKGIKEVEGEIAGLDDQKSKQNLQNFIDYNLNPTLESATEEVIEKVRAYQDTPLYKIENFANKVKNGEGIVNKLLNTVLKKVINQSSTGKELSDVEKKYARVKYDD